MDILTEKLKSLLNILSDNAEENLYVKELGSSIVTQLKNDLMVNNPSSF
jgi:hypothetical protein